MYPFERFSERAKRVLTLAQGEAERSHISYIGTEHLLLGLLLEGEGLAAKALNNLGVAINQVRSTIESVLGRDERIKMRQIIPTSRVKKVIEISFEEARRMGNDYVGTEHLLLGLLVEGEGVAAHVLEDLGVNLEKVRVEIELLRGQVGIEESAAPAEFVPAKQRAGWLQAFSSTALAAIARAGVEADRQNRHVVGTRDLLLGMLRDPGCRSVQLLSTLGVDVASMRVRLEPVDMTSRAGDERLDADEELTAVVERSFIEALRFTHGTVHTEHLLIALLSAGTGEATRVLLDAGLTARKVRAALDRG